MLLGPPYDLRRVPVRTAVTVAAPAVSLVQEALVVALHLVVEYHATDAPAALANALLGTLVGAIHVDVVGQLARLPEAGVELLPVASRGLVEELL